MSADAIDVVFPVVTFYGSVGALTDAEGNVVEDTVASATWTAADTLVTVAANPNNAVDAVFTAIGNGVVPITVTGTTAAGSQVTGDGTATITGFGTTVGPAVKVAVDLSLTDPDSAPAAVPAAPGFPAT